MPRPRLCVGVRIRLTFENTPTPSRGRGTRQAAGRHEENSAASPRRISVTDPRSFFFLIQPMRRPPFEFASSVDPCGRPLDRQSRCGDRAGLSQLHFSEFDFRLPTRAGRLFLRQLPVGVLYAHRVGADLPGLGGGAGQQRPVPVAVSKVAPAGWERYKSPRFCCCWHRAGCGWRTMRPPDPLRPSVSPYWQF